MKLGDFHQLVSFELKRGSALDAMIPIYTKQAVSFLERNWPLKYMEEWCYITLNPGDQVVDMIWAFRNCRFLRYPSGGVWKYLNKQSPEAEVSVPGGPSSQTQSVPPQSCLDKYFQIGMRYVRFNVPWNGTSKVQLEGIIYKFSDWQTTKSDYRSFLLDKGSDLLLYQAMLRICASRRYPRLIELYQPLRDEALKTFMNMDQDAEFEGSEDDVQYGGIYS